MSGSPVAVGGSVTFKIVITNTGEIDLDHVNLTYLYDQDALDFISSSIALVPEGIHEEAGVLYWNDLLPVPDGGSAAVWDAGESLSIILIFQARQASITENCVFGEAHDVSIEDLRVGPETEFVCARVVITSPEPSSSQKPAATPTTRPAATPTAVSTVAGATRVPATPRAGVIIVGPDTGTGDGVADGGMSTMVLLGLAVAAVSATAGLVLIRKAKD